MQWIQWLLSPGKQPQSWLHPHTTLVPMGQRQEGVGWDNQPSGIEALKAYRLHKCISCKGKRSRGLCARCNTSQVSFVGALPGRKLPAVSPSGGSCLSSAARSYITHNLLSSPLCCCSLTLFKCFYELPYCFTSSPTRLLHYSSTRAEGGRWELGGE